MTPLANALDPITLEVIHNGLLSLVDETFYALMKSAYSTNIKERHDHSCCLIDPTGRTIVQASRTQVIHISSMLGHTATILATVPPEEIREGDIFISNDPYAAGGSHLPDINFAAPIFVEGKLAAFSCNIAHHADIGGMVAGSMSSNMEEIYQEGLRLPVVKLFDRGRLVEDVLAIILLNVRNPAERRGDYFAQIAACRLGAKRFRELVEAHGLAEINAVADEIIRRTERRMRAAIDTIPDGEYRFEDVLDDDGVGTRNIPIKLQVTVKGGSITLDFAGTSKQVKGNINSPLPAVVASIAYILMALLDREIPCNQGILNALDVVAEPGSLVNPIFPAPVAARTHTCQRVVDAVIGALAEALPKAAMGASNGSNTMAVISGIDPRSGQPYLYFETYGGGCGARAFKDGKDGVQMHIPNTANTPIEVMETEFPLLVEEYSLPEDTGGAGRYRGGLALRRVIRPIGHDAVFTGACERYLRAPWGVHGGEPGASGEYLLIDDDGRTTKLVPKPPPTVCTPAQRIVVQSPGAGGYGKASERDRRLLALDWASGKFSADYLQRHYGLDREDLDALPLARDALDYAEE
jgi:N-methylhydantoinase B